MLTETAFAPPGPSLNQGLLGRTAQVSTIGTHMTVNYRVLWREEKGAGKKRGRERLPMGLGGVAVAVR